MTAIVIILVSVMLIVTTSLSYACDCVESQMDVNYSRATHVFCREVTDAGTYGTRPKGATFKVSPVV